MTPRPRNMEMFEELETRFGDMELEIGMKEIFLLILWLVFPWQKKTTIPFDHKKAHY